VSAVSKDIGVLVAGEVATPLEVHSLDLASLEEGRDLFDSDPSVVQYVVRFAL
jgi:hypothetical protein